MKSNNLLPLVAALLIVCVSSTTFAQSTVLGNNLSGGSASTPAEFLGSGNAYDVLLKANGTEHMRILQSNGNVGIGTFTPGFRVDVSGGDVNVSAGSNGYRIGGDYVLWHNNDVNPWLVLSPTTHID